MKIFALSDLHLDGKQNKPMDVFAERWANHRERIFTRWSEIVSDGDCVLLPGDFCWAMKFDDAFDDLTAVSNLPGLKLLVRGNHDYWWASPTKMRDVLPKNMVIIQNDAFDIGPAVVCGTRGWLLPGSTEFHEQDRKIFDRELIRLEMSLKDAARRASLDGERKPIICMMHYPPLMKSGEDTGFTGLIEAYGACAAVYGHLHGPSCSGGFEGEKNGVEYHLCSSDYLGFEPKLIREFE